MLFLVYAFIPLIALVKKNVEYKVYERGAVIIFLWLMIGHYYESSQTSWSLSNLYFIGYVLFGDIISTRLKEKKNNIEGLLLIALSIGILVFNHVLLYRHVELG